MTLFALTQWDHWYDIIRFNTHIGITDMTSFAMTQWHHWYDIVRFNAVASLI
jgi:hypothetical protein